MAYLSLLAIQAAGMGLTASFQLRAEAADMPPIASEAADMPLTASEAADMQVTASFQLDPL